MSSYVNSYKSNLASTSSSFGSVRLWDAHTIKKILWLFMIRNIRLLKTLANREADAEYFILSLSLVLWCAPCGLFSLWSRSVLASVMCLEGNRGGASGNSTVNFLFSCSLWFSDISANSWRGLEDSRCHTNLDLLLLHPSSSNRVSAAAQHPRWEKQRN